jgi:hypothetical protein
VVLGLLQREPLARPVSAAEVIARLDVIGELPPRIACRPNAWRTAPSSARASSAAPRSCTNRLAEHARAGRGAVALIEAEPGMRRTRRLREACGTAFERAAPTCMATRPSMCLSICRADARAALRRLRQSAAPRRDARGANAGRDEYGSSMGDEERWFRPTDTPTRRRCSPVRAPGGLG